MMRDIEAGRGSAELAHRGNPARTRVHALVEAPDNAAVPMAQADDALVCLAKEPDPYAGADAIARFR